MDEERRAPVWNRETGQTEITTKRRKLVKFQDALSARHNQNLETKLESATTLLSDLETKLRSTCPISVGDINITFNKFKKLVAEMDEMLEEAQASV